MSRLFLCMVYVLALCVGSVADAQEQDVVFRVYLRIDSYDAEKEEFDKLNPMVSSFFNRELRTLRDVEVVDDSSVADFVIALSLFSFEHYVMYDATVMRTFEALFPYQCADGAASNPDTVQFIDWTGEGVHGVRGRDRGGVKGVAEAVVAYLDSEFLEIDRQTQRKIKDWVESRGSGSNP